MRPQTQVVETVYHEPVAEYRTREVWVEPEYVERTIEVNVPAVVETRRVAVHDHHGRVVGHRLVERIVEPAHVELRTERVKVREGYFRTVREKVYYSAPTRTVIETHHASPSLHLDFGHVKKGSHHKRRTLQIKARSHSKPQRAVIKARSTPRKAGATRIRATGKHKRRK